MRRVLIALLAESAWIRLLRLRVGVRSSATILAEIVDKFPFFNALPLIHELDAAAFVLARNACNSAATKLTVAPICRRATYVKGSARVGDRPARLISGIDAGRGLSWLCQQSSDQIESRIQLLRR